MAVKAADLASGPALQTVSGDDKTFAGWRDALQTMGYGETSLSRLFGYRHVWEFFAVPAAFAYTFGARCDHADTPVAWLARLWLLSLPITEAQAEKALGADTVHLLQRRGVLKAEQGQVRSTVDLYPCENAWVFTDHNLQVLSRLNRKHVYELGGDSYGLARLAPRPQVERALDLCTGSGIHAILAARHCQQAVGVDINPRTLHFARMNAGINGVADRCRFVESDLYSAVADETFDLILANPPWIPTPQKDMQIHRTGGESGEVLTQRVVEGVPRHLRVGGTLAMFVNYPEVRGSSYLDRIVSWLGGPTGYGVALVDLTEVSLDAYIRMHQMTFPTPAQMEREARRWMDSYAGFGIERIRVGMAYLRRLPEGRPGWQVHRELPIIPEQQMAPYVADWLDALQRFHDPGWTAEWNGWRPRAKAGRTLWRDSQGRGKVEFDTHGWDPTVNLDVKSATLIELLTAGQTAAEVGQAWASRHGIDAAAARTEVQGLLRTLGTQNIVA